MFGEASPLVAPMVISVKTIHFKEFFLPTIVLSKFDINMHNFAVVYYELFCIIIQYTMYCVYIMCFILILGHVNNKM